MPILFSFKWIVGLVIKINWCLSIISGDGNPIFQIFYIYGDRSKYKSKDAISVKYGRCGSTFHTNTLIFSRVHLAQCGLTLSCCKTTPFLLIIVGYFSIKDWFTFQHIPSNMQKRLFEIKYFLVIHLESVTAFCVLDYYIEPIFHLR